MLHDLEQGINDEPFRGAGYLQLPLMSVGALYTNTPGRIKTLTLVPVCQTLTTLTFWWLLNRSDVQLLFLSCSVIAAPSVQQPSSVSVIRLINYCLDHSSAKFAA